MSTRSILRLIRRHGIDAWPTHDPDVVLAMDVTTERRPGGIMTRCEPVLLDATDRASVATWLGY